MLPAQNRFESVRDEIVDLVAEKSVGPVSRLWRSIRLRERTHGYASLRRGLPCGRAYRRSERGWFPVE